jgi:hypothetical protein
MKKKYHLVHYVEQNSSRLKKFKTLKALKAFVHEFEKEHGRDGNDNWIDYAVTGITGSTLIYRESLEVEE